MVTEGISRQSSLRISAFSFTSSSMPSSSVRSLGGETVFSSWTDMLQDAVMLGQKGKDRNTGEQE